MPETAFVDTLQPTLPVEQKSTDWTKIILAAVVGLGLLACSAYAGYYYGTQQVPLAEEPTPLVSQPVSTPTSEPTTPPVTDPTAGWEVYSSEKYALSFKHPNLDSTCCGISGPSSDSTERVVVLADKSTTAEGTDKPFDGFGVYVETNPTGKSLEEYLEEQKSALLAWRTEMGEGKPTEMEESSISVGGSIGTILKEYTGWSKDIIFVPFPKGENILVIVRNEESEGSFDTTFNQILSTFKFLE